MPIPFGAWVALAGLNAAMAASKKAQQDAARQREANLRAAEIEAAPWTGRAPTTQVSTPSSNIWGELAGAGVNTLGQGMALQQSGLFTEGAELPGAELPGGYDGGATLTPSAQAAMDRSAIQENVSTMWPWESKRISWLNTLKSSR